VVVVVVVVVEEEKTSSSAHVRQPKANFCIWRRPITETCQRLDAVLCKAVTQMVLVKT
jgi:hypothetical protein